MSKIDHHFTNIQHHITAHLQTATSNIRIAVAWFTDAALFHLLCTKAANGVKVELLLLQDEINQLCGINHQLLHHPPLAQVLWVAPDGFTRMHNKFCIIDHHTVMTGSYNWTNQAQQNDENIVIIANKPPFAAGYINQFYHLWRKHGGAVPAHTPDVFALRLRLQMLLNALELADADDIAAQTAKIVAQLPLPPPHEWQHLHPLLQQQLYPQAAEYLAQWLKKTSALTLYTDYESETLALELQTLELQINALRDEKTDLETLIAAFTRRHQMELGELILQILQLQTEIARQELAKYPDDPKKQQAYENLQTEYQQSYEQYQQAKKQPQPANLPPDDENLLKKLYKKAATFCHPDMVQDEAKKHEAEELFKELHNAYQAKNLHRVKEILEYLENGKPFSSADSSSMQKDRLRARIAHLRTVLNALLAEVNLLRNSDAYKLIVEAGNDWDAWFTHAKKDLEKQLSYLQNKT